MNPKVRWIFILFAALASADLTEVRVNKCCEIYEIYMNDSCMHINDTKELMWRPIFTSENGKTNIQKHFMLIIGLPDCGSIQQRGIHHYQNSADVLRLLPDGKLRHYLYHDPKNREEAEPEMYYDYEPGQYCMDKYVDGTVRSDYALVCAPIYENVWTNTEFLMRNVVNPITHGLSIICFLFIAIVYFVMPTLRDLVGNIVTTIAMCLLVSQIADLVRLLTIFNNHVSIIVAETICYVSLMGAFFWLNSLGYYIWKTFRSRNVFLRITDGRKYCYYSVYAWCCTVIMGVLAVFAHFTMDYPQKKKAKYEHEQEAIGSLGMIIFFVPVATTVLVNIFFFATTLQIINRMNTYGRIHHKLKHSFRMFLLLFLVLTITWLFFLLSFSKYEGLIYSYIIVNSFQAPLVLYICVFNQKHVSYLIRKTCCYNNCVCPCCRPEPELDWGDEMTAMNTGIY